MDAGELTLIIVVVAIILGILGAYLVNTKFHPPGEELRRRNRPPNAR